MNNENIAYDDNSSLLGAVVKTAVFGGAIGAGAGLILDREGFKNVVSGVYKKVTTEVPPDYSSFDMAIKGQRDNLSSIAKTRAVNQGRRGNNRVVDINTMVRPKVMATNGLEQSTEFARKSFGYSSVSELGDVGTAVLKSLKNDYGLDIVGDIEFNGSVGIVKYKEKGSSNVSELKLPFAKETSEGSMIVKDGNSTYSAPSKYRWGTEPGTKNLSGEIHVTDWNQSMKRLFDQKDGIYHLAAMSKEHESLLSSDAIAELRRTSARVDYHAAVVEKLKEVSMNRVMKEAMKVFMGKQLFAPPGNPVMEAKQATLIQPDEMQMYELGKEIPGFNEFQLGRSPASHIGDKYRSDIGTGIKRRVSSVLSAQAHQITYNNVPINDPSLDTVKSQTLAGLRQNGLTPNVSSSQAAKGVMNATGAITSPDMVDSMKTVSDFWFKRRSTSPSWRTTQRYRGNGNLSATLEKMQGTLNTFGYIDFLGEEDIAINTSSLSASKLLKVESTPQIPFIGYDPVRARGEKLLVKRVGTFWEREITLEDLHDQTTRDGKILHNIMTSKRASEFEIHGFEDGMYLGIGVPSKHIKDINNIANIGNEAEEIRMRYQSGYMTAREYQNMLELRREAGTNAIPMRIVEDMYKGGIFGGTNRAEVSRVNFKNARGHFGQVSKLVGNRDFDLTVGIELFDNMRATMHNGQMAGMKGAPGLMSFAHSMIGGLVNEMSQDGRRVTLEGDMARRMAKVFHDRGGIRSGKIDLSNLIINGGFSFNVNTDNPEIYQEQLDASVDLFGQLLESHIEGNGNVKIMMTDQDIRSKMDARFQWAKERWAEYKKTGIDIPADEKKRVVFPIMPSITPLEGMALIQGKNTFNAGRYSTRDMPNMLTMPNIMKEILVRSDTDTVRLIKEAELLRSSIGQADQNRKMYDQAKEHIAYLKEAYGHDHPQITQLEAQIGDIKDIDRVADIHTFGEGVGLNLNQLRGNPQIAAQSYMNPEKNMFGKYLKVDDGRLFYFPSADSFGGMTAINEERATFEGHVGALHEVMASALDTGYVKTEALNRVAPRIDSLAEAIVKEKSKSVISDALYSKNARSMSLSRHQVIDQIFKETAVDENLKAILGNIVGVDKYSTREIWEQTFARAQERLKEGSTVMQEMASMYGDGIHIDKHIGVLANKLGKNNGMSTMVADAVMKQREHDAKELEKMLDNLQSFYHTKYNGNNLEQLETEVKKVTDFIQRRGAIMMADRQPDIYPTSNMAAYGFVDNSLIKKQISTSYLMNLQQKADYDGDTLKVMELVTKGSRTEAHKNITGVQKTAYRMMDAHKKRMKELIKSGTETFETGKGYTSHIFGLKEATMHAAFFTKGYTGSINVAARQIKELQDRAFKSGLKGEISALEEARTWSVAMPSLLLEQPILSSKHLMALINNATGVAGQTKSEAIIESLKSLKQDDILKIFKESKGNIDPIMQMLMTDIQNEKGIRGQYQEALKVSDVLMDYQANFTRFGDEQYKILQEYNGMDDAEFAKLRQFHEEHQNAYTPFAETVAAKESGLANKKMVQIWAEGTMLDSRNRTALMSQIEKEMPEFANMSGAEQYAEMRKRSYAMLNTPEEMLGFEATSSLPKTSRELKGMGFVKSIASSIGNFYKEAPLERGIGTGILGMAVLATANLLTGSTPSNPSDMPSAHNPVMGTRGMNTISGHGSTSPMVSYNMSNSLLTDSSHHMRSVSSTINSAVGLNGHNVVNVRHDNTDPYLNQMQYYR